MRINAFGAKNALFMTFQINVKKNTCPTRNVRKTCFFEVLIFGGRDAAISQAGNQCAHEAHQHDCFSVANLYTKIMMGLRLFYNLVVKVVAA
jgi:hypothetical protein